MARQFTRRHTHTRPHTHTHTHTHTHALEGLGKGQTQTGCRVEKINGGKEKFLNRLGKQKEKAFDGGKEAVCSKKMDQRRRRRGGQL